MAVVDAVTKLVEEKLDLIGSHVLLVLIHVLFQIVIHELEDEV